MALKRKRRRLQTLEFIKDFRAGLTDPELMERHKLTQLELKDIFKKLVSRGYLKPDEFGLRPIGIDDTVMIDINKLDLD